VEGPAFHGRPICSFSANFVTTEIALCKAAKHLDLLFGLAGPGQKGDDAIITMNACRGVEDTKAIMAAEILQDEIAFPAEHQFVKDAVGATANSDFVGRGHGR